MFSPKVAGARSRYQSLGGTGETMQTRKRSSIFTPQRRSFANRSLNTSGLQTSRIFEESGQHKLEAFGQALPILVTEALTLKEKHIEPSVKISPTGWAWMVFGRRLLVWLYKTMSIGKTPPCYELSLPPSSLVHKADLVTLIPSSSDPNTLSCVAVSPEGAIRHWANMAHDGAFTEISTDLKGEECAAIIPIQFGACVIATTSSSLVLVATGTGQGSLRCRVLKPPQGMMKSIGRRMSTFIFGSGTQHETGTNFHQVVAGEMLDSQSVALYVLCGSFLQKWSVSADSEKMLYQCNIEQFVCDCMSHEIWHEDSSRLPSLHTWLLDMDFTRDGVVVLAAGVNPDVSRTMHYCLGMLHTEGVDSPRSFLSFSILRFTTSYSVEDESRLLSYRLLLPDPNKANAFLYDKKSILCTTVTAPNQGVDRLEFYGAGDKILGGGPCTGTALFFSSTKGLMVVRTAAAQGDVSLNESAIEPITKMETSLATFSGDSSFDDKLKAAFLTSCRGNVPQAQTLVDELFPPGLPTTEEPGSNLDRLVIKLSQEMIDDFPASDPRWAQSHSSVGSSSSLILIHQLEDKLKAHEYFVQFLKNVGLWDRLASMTVRGTVMQTTSLLCEHAEKLVAARTIRELHTSHQALVDRAVHEVLQQRGQAMSSSGLTEADIFYREVSKVDEVLETLVDLEDRSVEGDLSPREAVSLIITINSIMAGMLVDAIQYRQTKAETFQPTSKKPVKSQTYLPWTASEGSTGCRSLLSRQHAIIVNKALPDAQDSGERGSLFQQLMDLTCVLLDGYQTQLNILKMTSDQPTPHHRELQAKYETERTTLLRPFVTYKQYDRATSLGEKFLDFPTLVQVCEQTDNQDRLQKYMTQFQAWGFADYVFKWYLEVGKRGKLMTSSLSAHPQLSRFLQMGENRFMSWLHDINSSNFQNSHKTLFDLGIAEKGSAAKKKTLLSLSKLSALAADDPPDIVHSNLEVISEQLDLLLNQEQMPQEVIENMGLNPDNMSVYGPKELIEMHISDYNTHANEFDMKKALDLLSYVDKSEPDYKNVVVQIWSRAILRDDWSQIRDDQLESYQDTIFYKTVELVHSTGLDLGAELPAADVLLQSEHLQHMKNDTHFQFLIKTCFEQIQRVLKIHA